MSEKFLFRLFFCFCALSFLSASGVRFNLNSGEPPLDLKKHDMIDEQEEIPVSLDLEDFQHTKSTSFVDNSTVEFPTNLNARDFQEAESNPVPDKPGADGAIYNQQLFEGDIHGISAGTIRDFIRRSNQRYWSQSDDAYRQHAALRNAYNLWTRAEIPYVVSSKYGRDARKKIAAAISDYHKFTCIRFIPRQDHHRDYLYIRPLGGCWSMIGRSGGQQDLSLGDVCFSHGTILHELMHTTGFFHEQSRNDRDQYITLVKSNIIPKWLSQFKKYSLDVITHLGTTYDYGSIMHYHDTAFSHNGQKTIIPKERNARIGQRSGFSPTDIKELNLLYHCNQPSPGPQIPSTTTTPRPLPPRPRPTLPPVPRPSGPKCRVPMPHVPYGWYMELDRGCYTHFWLDPDGYVGMVCDAHGKGGVFCTTKSSDLLQQRERKLDADGLRRCKGTTIQPNDKSKKQPRPGFSGACSAPVAPRVEYMVKQGSYRIVVPQGSIEGYQILACSREGQLSMYQFGSSTELRRKEQDMKQQGLIRMN